MCNYQEINHSCGHAEVGRVKRCLPSLSRGVSRRTCEAATTDEGNPSLRINTLCSNCLEFAPLVAQCREYAAGLVMALEKLKLGSYELDEDIARLIHIAHARTKVVTSKVGERSLLIASIR